MNRSNQRILLWLLPCVLVLPLFAHAMTQQLQAESPALQWVHLTTTTGALPEPSGSKEQTASLILDIDQDGLNDFVIGSRSAPGPALVWFRRNANGWERYVIEPTIMEIEAGGAEHDIDGDGDLDLVMGGDAKSNAVWWWENPAPNFAPDRAWSRHLIKNTGGTKHHDQLFGDFDGDGQAELVFWNQRASTLFLAEIPADPRNATNWPLTPIYRWTGGLEHEGLAKADIDGDGVVDIVGGGRWFKFAGTGRYTPMIIDDSQRFSRAAAGQLIPGGAPEVVFGCGDCTGPLKWYARQGDTWVGHELLSADLKKGHSLALADFNGDGALDVFTAEMRLNGDNDNAKMLVLLGDNQGTFTPALVATGFGNHESKVGDLDGDGSPDILGKPYNWETPRLDLWLNQRYCATRLGQWQRHVIDDNRPWRALFVLAGDLNQDGLSDVVTGGWWYRNPGTAGGTWVRTPIGAGLNNVAAVYDFDGDGDLDLLGGQGEGNADNVRLAWARNDGQGAFTVLTNLANGEGDFLQGVAVGRWHGDALTVALSWHKDESGVQALQVPTNPSTEPWTWQRLTTTTQHEALSSGDIDRDGDLDLLLGTIWLRNDGPGQWQPLSLHTTTAKPDRNRLVDMNGDGRLDAVVSYEAVSKPGLVAWYEQGVEPTAPWREHQIAMVTGPMSLDVADLDEDGDLDLVVGEHNLANPAAAALYLFENSDGRSESWRQYLVHRGDEHHDGAQLVDIDGDGDRDIISIGWGHKQLLLYENRGTPCPTDDSPTATPTGVATSTPQPTVPATSTPTLVPTAPTSTPTPTADADCSLANGSVSNPNFDTSTVAWALQKSKNATLTIGAGSPGCGGAAYITLAKPQKAQLIQSQLRLVPNARYRLSFAAYSTNGDDLAVQLHKHSAPFTNYGLKVKRVDLTTGWQTFTYEFTTKGFNNATADGRLRFWFDGKQKEVSFGLDTVVLEEITETAARPLTPADAVVVPIPLIDRIYQQAPVVELYSGEGDLVAAVFLATAASPQLVVGAADQPLPPASEIDNALQLLTLDLDREAPLIPIPMAPGVYAEVNKLFLPILFGR